MHVAGDYVGHEPWLGMHRHKSAFCYMCVQEYNGSSPGCTKCEEVAQGIGCFSLRASASKAVGARPRVSSNTAARELGQEF